MSYEVSRTFGGRWMIYKEDDTLYTIDVHNDNHGPAIGYIPHGAKEFPEVVNIPLWWWVQ